MSFVLSIQSRSVATVPLLPPFSVRCHVLILVVAEVITALIAAADVICLPDAVAITVHSLAVAVAALALAVVEKVSNFLDHYVAQFEALSVNALLLA